MRLLKFRVVKFRSVQDSGWLELDTVNALLGENESGKTNLLLPLWKLKPASGGAIDLLADAPRSEYTEIRGLADDKKPVFVEAVFQPTGDEQELLAKDTQFPSEWFKVVQVGRRYNGDYIVSLPTAKPNRTCETAQVIDLVQKAKQELASVNAKKSDESLKNRIDHALDEVAADLAGLDESLSAWELSAATERLITINTSRATKSGGLSELLERTVTALGDLEAAITIPEPTTDPIIIERVISAIPSFIYYSNYGNLDSEIYLPHVIANLKRPDLGEREAAKARTLKVLFQFVGLSPQEILELGKEIAHNQTPTEDLIKAKATQKKERSVLLESASTRLTREFADWWQQGNYLFKFQADGDHFRIWVSDRIRPESVELENRSTGLQWFFSFFLVFLNERSDTHFGSILLLDEPGITLHPMSQKDLFRFFELLSEDNQLIYTTHSPFLMDPDKLDQAKAVFIGERGHSEVSSDLRARSSVVTNSETKALYPVHSALGLTVSEVLFNGCYFLLVEGPSDQFYLSAIKILLTKKGILQPPRELLFVPAGGVKGIRTTSKILATDDDNYPSVMLDSDSAGVNAYNALVKDTYAGREERVFQVKDFIGMSNAEIEDLADTNLVASQFTRLVHTEQDFEDVYDPADPIVPQMESFAKDNGIDLPKGWKVDVSRRVKQKMLSSDYSKSVDEDLLERWKRVFAAWLEAV